MKKMLTSVILFLCLTTPLFSDSYSISWTDTLNIPRDNNAEDIAYFQGYIYVLGGVYNGNNFDGLIAKYDASGNIILVDTIDFGNEDYFYGIAIDSGGFIYIAGRVNNGSNSDFTVIKLDDTFNQIWVKSVDNGFGDVAYDVTIDEHDNVYATGYTYIGNVEDYLTVKFTSSGDVVWMDTFNITQYDRASAVAVDSSGNVYVTGYSYMSTGPNYDYVTIKYDSNGTVVWVDTFGGDGTDYVVDIASSRDGNTYITGSIAIGNDHGFLTLKYDPDGNLLWADTVGILYHDLGKDIYVDANGYVYVTGNVYSYNNYNDCLILKYDPQGNIVWADTLDIGQGLAGRGVTVDVMGNIYLTCTIELLYNNNMLTVKYEPLDVVKENHSVHGSAPLGVFTVAKNEIYITWEREDGASFYLYTPSGRLIKKGKIPKEAYISGIPEGIYFLKVVSPDFKIDRKILVEQ